MEGSALMDDHDAERRIEAAVEDTKWRATMENRVGNVEGTLRLILIGLGAAALLIGTSIWDGIKQVLFK